MAEPCDGTNPVCAVILDRQAKALEEVANHLRAMNGSLRKHETRITVLEDHDRYQEGAIKNIAEDYKDSLKEERDSLIKQMETTKKLFYRMAVVLILGLLSILGVNIESLAKLLGF